MVYKGCQDILYTSSICFSFDFWSGELAQEDRRATGAGSPVAAFRATTSA